MRWSLSEPAVHGRDAKSALWRCSDDRCRISLCTSASVEIVITPGMDHIGFKVESVETLKADVKRIADDNPRLSPSPLGTGKEGAALEKLFERSCSLGQHCLADPDGILIDVMAD